MFRVLLGLRIADLPFCALVELITVIEERFGFEMDEEEITAEVVKSVGSLSTYVAEHRR